MMYKIWLYEDRFNALKNEMPDNIKELSREKKDNDHLHLIQTEIKVDDSFDILRIFHAGMHHGISYKNK